MEIAFTSAREHPEHGSLHGGIVHRTWPEFMGHDPVAHLHWSRLYSEFAECQLSVLVDGEVAGMANGIPLQWSGRVDDLPEEGWDWALRKGVEDRSGNVRANVLCGLQIAIDGGYRGRGLSPLVVDEMKALARRMGAGHLLVPVRPNLKSRYPLIPMEDYVEWEGPDGLPFDPWLRVHRRLGGRILGICHRSMRIPGTVADWEAWTGLRMRDGGDYVVEGALVPVRVDHETDLVEYVEPNVWVAHPIG